MGVHPMIANPDFKADDFLYKYDSFGAIGLDLWQVKSGTVFDNFLVTDDVDEAIEAAKAVVDANQEKEKAMKEEQDKEAEEAAAAEEDDDEDEMDMDDLDEEEFDDDFDEDEFDGHDEL